MFKNVHILEFLEQKNSKGNPLKVVVTEDFNFDEYKIYSDKNMLPKATYYVVIRGN